MLASELPLPKKFLDLMESEGIASLYPPQADAVESGILDGRNLVLCTPTASGKTLAAELALMSKLVEKKKVVYVVPLRALAYEKYNEFARYRKLGYDVRLEVGDLDSGKYARKPRFDVLVATAEKCDSIMRSKPEWFRGVGLLVLDEIHLIGSDRGPVYEIIAAKFRGMLPDIQVLGLSATVGNAGELAGWLNAGLVESGWRPVELRERVLVGSGIEFMGGVVSEAVLGGGQVLVFVNSRRSAESVAEELGRRLTLEGGNKEELASLGEKILEVLSSPTKQCRRLAGCVKTGVGFHHAGLVNRQRVLVEDSFKEGLLKVVVATPTLAAGVNLPARVVLIRDVKRYGIDGMVYIPVFEYKQQAGRAGRPKYDTFGESITLAKSESDAEFITEKYVRGTVESINSLLGAEPILRFHVLAQVASNFTKTHEALLEFMRSTFFGFEYGLDVAFKNTIKKVVDRLLQWGFIKEEGRFLAATPLGVRVSELYIDPLTAHNFLVLFYKAEAERKYNVVGLLEVLCDASEMKLLSVKSTEESRLWSDAYAMEDVFLRDVGGFDLDWEFIPRFKTALMFLDWVEEKTEDHVLEAYNVAPGQLYQRLQVAEWLSYSARELARLSKLKKTMVELSKLETRLTYGVREELLGLIDIKGIGRVRARRLFNAGVKTREQIKKAGVDKVASLLGRKTAENILREL